MRMISHIEALSGIPGLRLLPDEKLLLLDLSPTSPKVSVIMDRPAWLAREGLLTLSLFKDDFRAFTVSFSLLSEPDLSLFIGGIQGRNDEEILSLYRDLTKDFHGLRPRDLLLEVLRLFAVQIGAKHIYAVADDWKTTRHSYFGKGPAPGLFYDEIWQDRGGTRVAGTHFELPLEGTRRDLQEVSSKKRSMYRKRYDMLNQIAASMPDDFRMAKKAQFDAK
jgi:uncharacterized protein VirK/YbjX